MESLEGSLCIDSRLQMVQRMFTSIMSEIFSEPLLLAQFMVWLDQKMAEYKFTGCMDIEIAPIFVVPGWLQKINVIKSEVVDDCSATEQNETDGAWTASGKPVSVERLESTDSNKESMAGLQIKPEPEVDMSQYGGNSVTSTCDSVCDNVTVKMEVDDVVKSEECIPSGLIVANIHNNSPGITPITSIGTSNQFIALQNVPLVTLLNTHPSHITPSSKPASSVNISNCITSSVARSPGTFNIKPFANSSTRTSTCSTVSVGSLSSISNNSQMLKILLENAGSKQSPARHAFSSVNVKDMTTTIKPAVSLTLSTDISEGTQRVHTSPIKIFPRLPPLMSTLPIVNVTLSSDSINSSSSPSTVSVISTRAISAAAGVNKAEILKRISLPNMPKRQRRSLKKERVETAVSTISSRIIPLAPKPVIKVVNLFPNLQSIDPADLNTAAVLSTVISKSSQPSTANIDISPLARPSNIPQVQRLMKMVLQTTPGDAHKVLPQVHLGAKIDSLPRLAPASMGSVATQAFTEDEYFTRGTVAHGLLMTELRRVRMKHNLNWTLNMNKTDSNFRQACREVFEYIPNINLNAKNLKRLTRKFQLILRQRSEYLKVKKRAADLGVPVVKIWGGYRKSQHAQPGKTKTNVANTSNMDKDKKGGSRILEDSESDATEVEDSTDDEFADEHDDVMVMN